MKIRKDFVTNSSSSSFVITKDSLPETIKTKVVAYIEDMFEHVTYDALYDMCQNCDVHDVYYLVDYAKNDNEIHVWVRRDEAMYDEFIDDILYEYDRSDLTPKFDYHY